VEEQSHKDEMRAALRGDFERLRRRRAGEFAEVTESGAPLPPVVRAERELVRQDMAAASWLHRLLRRA